MKKGLLNIVSESKINEVKEVKLEVIDIEEEVKGLFTNSIEKISYAPQNEIELIQVVTSRFGDVGYNVNELTHGELVNIACQDEHEAYI